MRKTNLVLSECFTMTHNERSLVLSQNQSRDLVSTNRRTLNSEQIQSYEERRKTSKTEHPKKDDFDVRSISSHRSNFSPRNLIRSISNDFGLKHGKFLIYLRII